MTSCQPITMGMYDKVSTFGNIKYDKVSFNVDRMSTYSMTKCQHSMTDCHTLLRVTNNTIITLE